VHGPSIIFNFNVSSDRSPDIERPGRNTIYDVGIGKGHENAYGHRLIIKFYGDGWGACHVWPGSPVSLTMEFRFVENNKIDAKSRKAIRSHVMKGKNAGKTRNRTALSNEDVEMSAKKIIPRPLYDDVAYFPLPVQSTLHARRLIHECTLVFPARQSLANSN
jgi:hypothetical protein